MKNLKGLEKNLVLFMNLGEVLICKSYHMVKRVFKKKKKNCNSFILFLQLIGRCKPSLFLFFMPMTKTNHNSLLWVKPWLSPSNESLFYFFFVVIICFLWIQIYVGTQIIMPSGTTWCWWSPPSPFFFLYSTRFRFIWA